MSLHSRTERLTSKCFRNSTRAQDAFTPREYAPQKYVALLMAFKGFILRYSPAMEERQMILVLEDDGDQMFFMQRAFLKLGLGSSVRFAQNGNEGISYLEGKGRFENRAKFPLPSVVVTDLKMPLVDGFEVLEWMRKHPQYCETPVFVLSSSDLPEDRAKATHCGATGYFTKPRVPEKLLPLLKEMQLAWQEKLAHLRRPSA
jgi:CheY-like chemotaxis protein